MVAQSCFGFFAGSGTAFSCVSVDGSCFAAVVGVGVGMGGCCCSGGGGVLDDVASIG